VDFTDMTNT